MGIMCDNQSLRRVSGRTGMAPLQVQTKAETSTASRWASRGVRPLISAAMKAAVNESPAPTVSATVTCGVSINEGISEPEENT